MLRPHTPIPQKTGRPEQNTARFRGKSPRAPRERIAELTLRRLNTILYTEEVPGGGRMARSSARNRDSPGDNGWQSAPSSCQGFAPSRAGKDAPNSYQRGKVLAENQAKKPAG